MEIQLMKFHNNKISSLKSVRKAYLPDLMGIGISIFDLKKETTLSIASTLSSSSK